MHDCNLIILLSPGYARCVGVHVQFIQCTYSRLIKYQLFVIILTLHEFAAVLTNMNSGDPLRHFMQFENVCFRLRALEFVLRLASLRRVLLFRFAAESPPSTVLGVETNLRVRDRTAAAISAK